MATSVTGDVFFRLFFSAVLDFSDLAMAAAGDCGAAVEGDGLGGAPDCAVDPGAAVGISASSAGLKGLVT